VTKFLLLIVVGYLFYSYLRRERLKGNSESTAQASPSPQIMVECKACGVHLPQNDALTGSLGYYCTEAHLKSNEPR